MEEKEYRAKVQEIFQKLEKAFDTVDPDLAELVNSQGALSVTYSNGSKLILSQQPTVRQIWVAAASRGIAHHFNYDQKLSKWLDDKSRGIEIIDFVKSITKEICGIEINYN